MMLNKGQLIGLPVYTLSGQHLGRVVDFELDASSHIIKKYIVKSGGLIKEFLQKELIINREQVISISDERMVVDDSLIMETELKKTPIKGTVPAN